MSVSPPGLLKGAAYRKKLLNTKNIVFLEDFLVFLAIRSERIITRPKSDSSIVKVA